MGNKYIFVEQGKAFEMLLVNDDNGDGRYFLYDFARNNVYGAGWDSPIEAETAFDLWVGYGRYDAWYPLVSSDD